MSSDVVLRGMEEAVRALPVAAGEDARQTVRILEGSTRSSANLTGAKRTPRRELWTNVDLCSAENSNTTVVLSASTYNTNI
jgi:hypothetical protein